MATAPAQDNAGQRAERHANEAERLLASRWLTSHIEAQAHATLAVYYLGRAQRSTASD
ncbi:MAG TPA: hypothetical protein VMT59_02145 [Gaiellaceae bacterium]|nr:hypothetical protein [Gaiellaceae bacterium]